MTKKEELIIKMMPLYREIKEWCRSYPEFAQALKITHPERFVAFQATSIYFSSMRPEDGIIGFYVYDNKTKLYKQDFIVNIKNEYKVFILYTRVIDGKSSKYVKDISIFRKNYLGEKAKIKSHHLTFNELPLALKPRALQATKLGDLIGTYGPRTNTQQELDALELKLRDVNTDLPHNENFDPLI